VILLDFREFNTTADIFETSFICTYCFGMGCVCKEQIGVPKTLTLTTILPPQDGSCYLGCRISGSSLGNYDVTVIWKRRRISQDRHNVGNE